LIQHYPHAATSASLGSSGIGATAGVTSLSFHPSGNYLLCSSDTGGLKVYDVREGRLLHTVVEEEKYQRGIGCSAFSFDGKHFASTFTAGEDITTDRNIKIWRMNSLLGSILEEDNSTKHKQNKIIHLRPATAPSSSKKTLRSIENKSQTKSTCHRQAEVNNIKSNSFNQSIKTNNISHLNRENHESLKELTEENFLNYASNLNEVDRDAPSQEKNGKNSSSILYEKERLPEVLINTLDHIVGQMNIITNAISFLDKRLSIQEDTVAQILAKTFSEKIQSVKENSNGVLQEKNYQSNSLHAECVRLHETNVMDDDR